MLTCLKSKAMISIHIPVDDGSIGTNLNDPRATFSSTSLEYSPTTG